MDQLTPLLEQLAAQLNTTVEFLWQVMVRQAFISAMGQVTLYVMYLVFAFVSFRHIFPRLIKRYRKEAEDEDGRKDGTFPMAGMVALGIVLIILILPTIVGIPNLFTKLLNPEYWALQQILEYVR